MVETAVINGFISSFRNNILSSSVATVMFGFSNGFKNETSKKTVMLLSVLILLVSLSIGINAMYGHYLFIKHIEKNEIPEFVESTMWNHLYIASGYNIIVAILLVLTAKRLVKTVLKTKK